MHQFGIGARLPRKEDDRLMRGRGQFVGDIAMPGLCDVAFARSPYAHASLKRVVAPDDIRSRVYNWRDMDGVGPIRALSGLPGFKPSEQPVLASDKLRFVGEPFAMCVAETRAEAEDMAARVSAEVQELPVIADVERARAPDAPLVHEHWSDNIYLTTELDKGDLAKAKAEAAVSLTRRIKLNRQCMAPLEGTGVVAWWDDRLNQLTVYTSTQMPHMMRTGLAECLGLDQGQLRVVAPDVGGGFGYKSVLHPEEVCVAWLAMRRRHPVRWLEDRREHLVAAANTRQHDYEMTVHADAEGRLLAFDATAVVDVGAYSVWPFSACLESAQIASILPGPYMLPAYRCTTYSVATNKPPFTPYRGVARTGVCFAAELAVDAVAHALNLDPIEVRLKNLAPPEAMPYTNITGKLFDSGDYPESLRRAAAEIDADVVRRRQTDGEADGRLIGLGFATYCEQAAHGTAVYAAWGIPMVPGFEQAGARMTPDGGLELRVGVHSHGQGMETSMAQVAAEVLGIDPAKVAVVHGDTSVTPFSTGTWGSRSMVMAGGAVSRACEILAERIQAIGAHLLQTEPSQTFLKDGIVQGPGGSVSLKDVANAWYLAPEQLPADVAHEGLEVTAGYKPKVDSGTFSYATHAVVVAVDRDLGAIELLDYVVVEDGGTLVNPLIVDGQILGGTVQGIGTALCEESLYDDAAQPLTSTFADYLMPGAAELPDIRIVHMNTPSPFTAHGVKGIGEGGAIAPPAAIANAINDALRPLGAWIGETPMTPERVLAAIERGESA